MNFYQIAKNTFRESLREPIFYLLLASAILLIGLFPSFALFVFREQTKLVSDSCFATTLVFGLFCAVLCASHTVTREMKNGTVLLLLSKPVPRWSFILAKIAGIMAAMTLFVISCEAATLISLRIAGDQFELDFNLFLAYMGVVAAASLFGALRNYLAHKAFPSSASTAILFLMTAMALILPLLPIKIAEEFPLTFLMLLPVFCLIMFAIWIMAALTVTISTRFDMISNLTFCSLIFMGGLVSDYFFGSGSDSFFSLSALLYAILPNWQLFWLVDALAARKIIPWHYVLLAAAYSAVYISFLSFVAVIFFQNKEVASDASAP
jgi:hypothetical protein